MVAEQALAFLAFRGVFQEPQGDALVERQVMVRSASGHLFLEIFYFCYLVRVFFVDEPEYLDEKVQLVFIPEGT